MYLFRFLIFGFTVTACLTGCYYDNEERLYSSDGTVCDTVDVRYNAVVRPLLENNCYSCHSVANNVAGSPFETHPTLKPLADNGRLVQRINDVNTPMPPTGLLPECDRLQIEAWVRAGAQNN